MRGFLGTSLVLIILQVVVQPQASERLSSGTNFAVAGLMRFLSPDVAGLPQRTPNRNITGPLPTDPGPGRGSTPDAPGANPRHIAYV